MAKRYLNSEVDFPYDLELLKKCCDARTNERSISKFFSKSLLDYLEESGDLAVVPFLMRNIFDSCKSRRAFGYWIGLTPSRLVRQGQTPQLSCHHFRDLAEKAFPDEDFKDIIVGVSFRAGTCIVYLSEKEQDLLAYIRNNSEFEEYRPTTF